VPLVLGRIPPLGLLLQWGLALGQARILAQAADGPRVQAGRRGEALLYGARVLLSAGQTGQGPTQAQGLSQGEPEPQEPPVSKNKSD